METRRASCFLCSRYIADFFASAAGLVVDVEVDGACHATRTSADARWDRVLAKLGYRVLRLDASTVLRHPPLVAVALVQAALTHRR